MPIELSGNPKEEFVFNINTNNIVNGEANIYNVLSVLIGTDLALFGM